MSLATDAPFDADYLTAWPVTCHGRVVLIIKGASLEHLERRVYAGDAADPYEATYASGTAAGSRTRWKPGPLSFPNGQPARGRSTWPKAGMSQSRRRAALTTEMPTPLMSSCYGCIWLLSSLW